MWFEIICQKDASVMTLQEENNKLVPPINFALVCKGVYRSGYPNPKNFKFLEKIGLKSILYLCPEEYQKTNREFLEQNGIQLLHFGMNGNKEPFVDIPEEKVKLALKAILNPENHPIMIHCNKGKHRTGCVVGCLRKVQNWSLTSVFEEYRRHAGAKVRSLDLQFIELFDESSIVPFASARNASSSTKQETQFDRTVATVY